MLPEKVPQLTIPLSPYLQPGEERPRTSKRIRPKDALDLESLVKEIMPSAIATFAVGDKPWSVVSAVSPYSPDVHVMVIETSVDRYLPGPEWVQDEEGDNLMKLWAAVLDFIAAREVNTTIHAGYNWSPRAWGEEEERNGFQSIPTKWHTMLWGWPPFPDQEQPTRYAKWVDTASLAAEERRLLGDNNYAEPFGHLMRSSLEECFPEGTQFSKLFPHRNWKVDGRGLYSAFSGSLLEMLRTQGFFSQVLKPLAAVLEQIARELTEAMTTLNCSDIDEILLKTESGPLSDQDLRVLRAPPSARSLEEVTGLFQQRGYPESILKATFDPVENRCNEEGDRSMWWRKGFGYAMVFSSPVGGDSAEVRITPGIFIGPGGVVEAQGVVLRRPEDERFSDNELREKSGVLWRLADSLKAQFREY